MVATTNQSGFLGLLEAADRATLDLLGRTLRVPQGAVLMYEGEPGERVMILLSGRVKVTRLADGGHEALLNICDPGDLLGELSYLPGDTRIGTVTALEPVELFTAPSSVFRAYVERSPHVAAALAAVISQRLRGMTVTRTQFGSSDAMGRVAARLTELADRYGQQSERGLEISLTLSQEDITAWTGASRSSTTHALQTFRELGWIESRRRRIVVLDLDALRARSA
jgi:CRP/FNR family transcriptional regulator, cyclic AMP receptor protein